MYYILVPTMPLHTFSLNCGHVWDQSRTRNYCETLNLLVNNYERTLGLYYTTCSTQNMVEYFKDICQCQLQEQIQKYIYISVSL